MSRIGKKAVSVPQGVTANVSGQTVTAKGPKGQLAQNIVTQPGPIKTTDGPQGDRPPRQPKVRAPQFHAAGHSDLMSK